MYFCKTKTKAEMMTTLCNSLSPSCLRRSTACWALLLVMFVFPSSAFGQCPEATTQGRDFWLMFMTNHMGSSTFSLIAACDTATTITVSNPRTAWSREVVLDSAGSVTIAIPSEHAVTRDFAVVSEGGLHVTSTQPIVLYASNFQIGSYDIATIFPSSVLQSYYMAQTYREGGYAEVGFVALHDNTVLSMTLPDAVDSLPPGPHSVTLMAGQTYQLGGNHFSGMVVTSNGKPFAMFQGSRCTRVGVMGACDHLYEQCYPTLFWGNHFLLVPTAQRSLGDLILVTSLSDSCRLLLDGLPQATLAAGETFQFQLPSDTVVYLEASRPVSTCLYLKSSECDSCLGDPASVIIPPLEQGVESAVFQAINTPSTTQHYANIVVPACAVDAMKLDGIPIGTHFRGHPSGLSFAQLPITPGTHTLSNNQHGFVASFYGLGIYESYAYIAGSAIRDLSESLFIDSIETRSLVCRMLYCQGDTLTMRLESDEPNLMVEWVVDSQPVAYTDTAVSYLFTTPGIHSVQARYHSCDTLEAELEVMPVFFSADLDTTCFNRPYHWREHTLDSTGYFVDSLLTLYGCDSLFALDLFVIPQPQSSYTAVEDCHTGTYTLTASLAEAEGWPFSWSSVPHDTSLDGHATDTVVVVKPREQTLYTLNIDYRCPFVVFNSLRPIEWPGAAWEVNPDQLSYAHPWLDAYDHSLHATRRQWFVDQWPLAETGSHLRYDVPFEADSVNLMLVVSNNTCDDTLRRTLPFVHSVTWAPNAFTPGSDANSRFSILLDDVVADELLIYDRHGILVRRLEGPDPVWDGTAADGTPCPQSAYLWLLRYRSADQPLRLQSLTGTVTLLR